MVLLALNFSWYYIGTDFSSEGLAALQFAAKLHEMTMIASLTTAFLSYVRYGLTSKTGLPFGAAFAGLQVTQLSYLWSPEIWGLLASRSYGWKPKLRMALAIFFVALLIATVGPASAAAMVRTFILLSFVYHDCERRYIVFYFCRVSCFEETWGRFQFAVKCYLGRRTYREAASCKSLLK